MARAVIKNEQTKLDKRAECRDYLDDVQDMLDHNTNLVGTPLEPAQESDHVMS